MIKPLPLRSVLVALFVTPAVLASPPRCVAADLADIHPSVGMPATIEQLVLKGSELEAKPIDSAAPVVVRIVAVYPHGDSFRYDLVYYGLEPGEHDLKDYLQRKTGSSTDDLPKILVTISTLLPPGQIEPHTPAALATPRLGGYRTALALGATAWLAGLAAILLVGRHRRRVAAAELHPKRTLADRLRPLIDAAQRGDMTDAQRAELERTLLTYWRTRLGMEDIKASTAMIQLREHAEAGPLIRQLEVWLHQPGGGPPVDVAALLEPYRHLPADAQLERQRDDADSIGAGAVRSDGP